MLLAGASASAVLIRSGASDASPALPVACGFGGHSGWARGEVRPRAIFRGPAAACSSAACAGPAGTRPAPAAGAPAGRTARRRSPARRIRSP